MLTAFQFKIVVKGAIQVKFSKEELETIIDGNPVGSFHPYNLYEYDYDQTDKYIKSVVESIQKIKGLSFEVDFDSHGSGYASYVSVFCWKNEESLARQAGGLRYYTGIRLYICRLAPVAVFGKGQISIHRSNIGHDFLTINQIYEIPEGNWKNEVENIVRILKDYSYELLDKDYLKETLCFEAYIPTILVDKPYKVYDALFYWED